MVVALGGVSFAWLSGGLFAFGGCMYRCYAYGGVDVI